MEKHVDVGILNEISECDKTFEFDLVQEFLDSTGAMMEEMREGVITGDLQAVFTSAHTLKGSARAVGAELLAENCDFLENAIKQELSLDLMDVLEALDLEMEHVHMFFQGYFSDMAA